MKFRTCHLPHPRHHGARALPTLGLLFCGLLTTNAARAEELAACMTRLMQHSEDHVTIGELRSQCQQQVHGTAVEPPSSEPAVVSERIRRDRENVLAPFTLQAHKPNYMLLAAYNATGYNPEPYREQSNDPSLDVDDTEVQFQISIKTPLAVGLLDTVDIWAGYTNRSFWQLYNDASAPFRETNHEPEVWAQFNPRWNILGFTNTTNTIGVVHQSNGRGGSLSRSWNRVFANLIVEKGDLALSFKPWYRIPESDDNDDNPDITDYLGHFELRGAYKFGDNVVSVMSRNNLESGFSRGAVEVSWSFPLGDYRYLKGYLQMFNGYGESLIDYDQYTSRIGVGLLLTDWL